MVNLLAPELPSGGSIGKKAGQVGRDVGGAFYAVAVLGIAVLGVSALYRAARRRGIVPDAAHPPTSGSQPSWFGA